MRLLLICFCLLISAVFTGCGTADPQPAGPSEVTASSSEPAIPEKYLAGKEIYDSKCELCHDKGEEGAPRLGNALQWEKRIPQGIDVLTKHAIEGYEGERGEMPPQGEKFSDEEVRSAVEYMMFCVESP